MPDRNIKEEEEEEEEEEADREHLVVAGTSGRQLCVTMLSLFRLPRVFTINQVPKLRHRLHPQPLPADQ
ncbi:hypothetical protein CRUP_034418 [Coryphaenoides rupestris]|nr:hypothetical protein CRUP_034418 [Coryphaenoides rupestris]